MLKLPNITLIALTNRDFGGHKKAIDKSCEGIEWGDVKIIWDEKITGIDEWNKKVIFELHRYVFTDYALLIHSDGYVINPNLWDNSWLELDYIGSPWPLPQDDFSYRDKTGKIQRVGNSVSLRSKKLMELPTLLDMEWKSYHGNTNEDGYICVNNRHTFEAWGCKFATFEQALKFGKEAPLPENESVDTFLFHEFE